MNERVVIHPPVKDSNGKYYVTVSYYANGIRKQKRKSGFDKSKDAKKYAEDLKKKIEKEMPVIKATGSHQTTFQEFAEQLIEIKKSEWSYNTAKIRRRSLYHCDFKDKRIIDVNKMDLAKNVKRLEALYAYNTVYNTLSGWKVFLNAAVDYNYIAIAPNYKMIKNENEDEDVIENVLSKEDADRMLDMITDRNMYLVTLIGLTTGARRGEIADININDIDFETGVWSICHQWKYTKGGYKRNQKLKTKNSYRKVPLSPTLLAAIKAYPHRTIDGFLFGRGLKTLIENSCELYKTLGFDITLHGLRHTYVTNLIRSRKFDLQSVAKLAGDTIETITKTYIHYLDEMQQENIEKIKELFG